MNNSYSPGSVANYFLEKSWKNSNNITPMKLQKLTYFAHGWYMALNKNDIPLIDEPFQAWEYGPVCSSIYHEFKEFGQNYIWERSLMKEVNNYGDLSIIEINNIPQEENATIIMLNEVWDRYSPIDAEKLSAMTHVEDNENPWIIARKAAKEEHISRSKEISNKDIQTYFLKIKKEGRAY